MCKDGPVASDAPEELQAGVRVEEAKPLEGGLTLSWDSLCYEIKDKKQQRTILNGASGEARAGQLVALLGPSGSGKTSLLNALAGRMPIGTGGQLAGNVRLNGCPVAELPCPLADLAGYVEQEDALFALSTVRETLHFGAELRLPVETTPAERAARIDEVARKLALLPCLDSPVGGTSFNGSIRGISGGERKRVCIGMELLARPSLLFLDEPTSGLDSCQAFSVVANLRALADAGHTVVCSIHQPRSAIYTLFDQLCLLSGGNVVYMGPTDGAEPYFAGLGHALPPKFNPADFFIDLVSMDFAGEESLAASKARVKVLTDAWQKAAAPGSDLRPRTDSGANRQRDSVLASRRATPAGLVLLGRPLMLHLTRTWREQMRDKAAFGMKIFFVSFFTAVMGLVYFQLDEGQRGIQDRSGLLFFLSMNQAFGAVIGCAQIIPRQLSVVNRERAARMYSVFPFYISCFIVNFPVEAVPQICSNAVIYYMAGLRGSFFVFFVTLFMENLAGISLGMILSAAFKGVTMAPQVAPMVVILFLIFSGFLLNSSSVPTFFMFLREASFIRYAFRGLMVNEFRDVDFECLDDPSTPMDEAVTCVATGQDLLESLGFNMDTPLSPAGGIDGNSLAILGCMILVCNALAYGVLIMKGPKFLGVKPKALPSPGSEEKALPVNVSEEKALPVNVSEQEVV